MRRDGWFNNTTLCLSAEVNESKRSLCWLVHKFDDKLCEEVFDGNLKTFK